MTNKHLQQGKSNRVENDRVHFSAKALEDLFKKNPDVIIESFTFEKHDVIFMFCEGMISQEIINESIYGRFVEFFKRLRRKEITKESISKSLYVPELKWLESYDEVIGEVFVGKLLVLLEAEQMIFSVDIAKRPQRQPEESSTEISIKGPRDGFVEDIFTNIALIRKRLRTNSLVLKNYEIGRRTKTLVSLLYIDDIAAPEIINEIDQRLKNIDIDGIYNGTQLKELLSAKVYNIYPILHYSGRPDFAVHSLLTGRFVIAIDGVQYVLIGPINLSYLYKTAEDGENTYVFNAFERFVRVTALFVAILLPGFWVALSSYHQNQIPVAFLGTLIESRRGVPLPAALEALLTILLFEFFREAGLRLPAKIGSTLSVVGGIVIGDATIRAGLASPIMIVIIASSSIAKFTLVNLSLHGIVAVLRMFVLLFSAFFGLFGFFTTYFLIILSLANVKSFGVPYITIIDNINAKEILKALFRLPEKLIKTRPDFLQTTDDIKTSKNLGEDNDGMDQ